jgi:DNA polymerase
LIGSIGYDRRRVFIANVVKCRPPQNRDPQPDEIEACGKHLQEQIDIIEPKVVVTLGRHSMQRYFPGEAISRVHGQPRRKGNLIVVPMYHPAAALHQGSLRKVIEADFAKLPEFLSRALNGGVTESPAAPVPAHLRAQPQQPQPQEATVSTSNEPESQQMRLL